jgi:hypothetical protein
MLTAEEMEIEKPSKEEIKEIMKELDRENKGYLTKYTIMFISDKTSQYSLCKY